MNSPTRTDPEQPMTDFVNLFAKYGKLRLQGGPTVDELYMMFISRARSEHQPIPTLRYQATAAEGPAAEGKTNEMAKPVSRVKARGNQ